MKLFIIAKCGERIKVEAESEDEALTIAESEFGKSPTERTYDFKDSEYQGEKLNSQLIAEY